ncbi:MFS general substrate transporter [Hypoxylon crocopeplum]|nr:MFS general substrate transporter [Hypoxylon crocopeplum]
MVTKEQFSASAASPVIAVTGSISDAQALEPIGWRGHDDPDNPKNWSAAWNWSAVAITSLGSFVSLSSSTLIAPALKSISHDLDMDTSTGQIALSIFILPWGLGPLIWAPLGETFGRKPVWLGGCVLYILANTLCGQTNSAGALTVTRLIAGFGASASLATAMPVLSDCWRAEERGRSLAVSTSAPLVGPAVGPRWAFYILSMFSALLLLAALFMFRETHSETILRRRAARLDRKSNEKSTEWRTMLTKGTSLGILSNMERPLRLLYQDRVVQIVVLYFGYNFGNCYIVLSTFANLWITRYGQSTTDSGLHYIALAIGYLAAGHGGGILMDRIWRRLHARDGRNGSNCDSDRPVPEYRVPLMLLGGVLTPIGLLWYGWTAETRQFWLLPDIGVAILGFGFILTTQALQAYVMDAFPHCVGSASAATQLFRGVAGFAFPIFGPKLYDRLGYGWGNSLMALLAALIGIPCPILLWKYRAWLMAKS